MIDRCVVPHGLFTRVISLVGADGIVHEGQIAVARKGLERFSTSELEHLLAQLFASFQQASGKAVDS